MSKPMARSMPISAASRPGADDAGDRAGFHHRHRLLLRQAHRHHAAVGAHDVDLAAELFVAQVAFEPAEIGLHARADEGVERGGRGALVFAVFADDLVGQRHEQLGIGRPENFADAALVHWIGVAVQEAHRDSFDVVRGDRFYQRLHLRLIERFQHHALGVHAFGDLEGQLARDQRLRAVKEQIERLDPVAAADGVGVAEAARRDQRGTRALALQHGVDGDG